MYQYYFLFGLALVWTVFAVFQDLRTREIANWLTFSLVAFVLAYRAIYAVVFDDVYFFVYGFFGVLIFAAFGYLFYYMGVFAGGDAKLLFGLGGILPYTSFGSYGLYGIGFFILLFSIGVLYTLIYSAFLIGRNFNSFKKSFFRELGEGKIWIYFCFLIFTVLFFISDLFRVYSWIFLLFPLVYFYARAVEKSCMVKLISPDKLTEGDWLFSDVCAGRKVIKRTVHGLSYDEILLLRKYGEKVLIKSGVPFAPVFLITLIFVVFYFLR